MDKKGKSFKELRQRAEKILNKRERDEKSDLDFLHLIHELEAHQVELELQNEELRRTQKQLEDSRSQYFDLYDSAAVGFVSVTREGLIARANRAARQMLADPEERLIGQAFSPRIHPEDYKLYRSVLKEASDFRGRQTCEVRVAGRHKRLLWVRIEAGAHFDEKGNFSEWALALSDITEHTRAEAALKRSEQKFRSLFENSPDAVFLTTPDGSISSANPAACAMFGWSEQEICNLGRSGIIDAEDPRLAQALKERQRTGRIQSHELTGIRKNGERFPVEVNAVFLTGEPVRSFVIMREITERKKAEEGLRESESRFRTAVESMPDSFAIFSAVRDETGRIADFQYRYINEAGARMNYRPAADHIGRTILELLPAHRGTSLFSKFIQITEEGGFLVEESLFYEDTYGGKMLGRFFDIRATKLGDGFAVIWRDVTERRHAEEALRQKAQLLDLSYDAILVWRKDGGIEHWNRGAEQLYGFTESEVLGRVTHKLLKTIHTAPWLEIEAAMRKHGQWEGELHHCAKDGHEVTVLARHQLMLGTDGIERILETNRDVTDRKRAEEALRESEERFHRLFEDDLTGDFVCTPKGKILLCNPAFSAIFGFSSPEAAVGTSMSELYIDPAERNSMYKSLKKQGKLEWYEAWRKRLDGKPIYVVENLVGHFNDRGELYEIQGYVFDNTERKLAEEERRRVQEALQELNRTLEQRVAERSELAAARAKQLQALVSELTLAEQRERRRLAEVLHDNLQQLLVGAKINSEILSAKIGAEQKQVAENIINLITQSIQTSRSLTAELSPVVLQQGRLSAAFQWLGRWTLENHGLAVEMQTDPDMDPEREDITVLLFQSARELLLNIVKHAKVKSARLEMSRDKEDRLHITVSDKGAGFDVDTIWEKAQAGTGFGLLSIRERLELMEGSLQIESSPGNGAAFSLIVPLATTQEGDEKRIQKTMTKVRRAKTSGGKIRLLLADDHMVVRQGLSTMLSLYSGIEVVGEAADGEEAVEKARALQPDVILMDISMPEMDGIIATRIIKTELPDIRIIGLSMHAKEDQAARMIEAGASVYCTKDGAADVLLSAIHGESDEIGDCGKIRNR